MWRATRSKASHITRRRQSLATGRWSSTSAAQPGEYDVVIVGGGPVGLALAGALGSKQALRETLRIALVEASDLSKVHNWNTTPDTFSNRVSSLTNVSQAFLKDIGAWSEVETERTTPIEEMQVWDGVSDARITFSASEIGLEHPEEGMARLTENLNLQRGLLRYIRNATSIDILDKTKVQSITTEGPGSWPLVHLENDQTLKTRLLVGADGLNSPVRSFAQIPSFGWTYDTHGLVATMCHSPRGAFENPNTTAYQRFLPTGPIAFLPLSPTVSSLVWSTKPAIATALKACDPSVMARMINVAFRLPEISLQYLHDLILSSHNSGTPISDAEVRDEIRWREQSHSIDTNSAYSSFAFDAPTATAGIPPADSQMIPPLVTSLQPGSVASFPLRFNHTEAYIGEGKGARTVLVGDAAHTIHPLAGQGLNLGLGDVECLARCIENAALAGGEIGSYTALLPYTQERYFENHKVMSACDKLHKLYSTTLPPIVWARSMGLEVINELDSIKAALMMNAGSSPRVKSSNGSLNVNGDIRQTIFNVAATGFQGLTTADKVIGTVRSGLAGAAAKSLKALAQAASGAKGEGRVKWVINVDFCRPERASRHLQSWPKITIHHIKQAIRRRIIEDLLTKISLSDQLLARVLTQEKLLSQSRRGGANAYPGGLTGKDLRRSETSLTLVCEANEGRLAEELDAQIKSIAGFLPENSATSILAPEDLPSEIRALVEEVQSLQEEVELSYRAVEEMVGRIKQIHPQLQEDLVNALEKYPPALERKRTAEDALTATTIETSLVKLSLIRARCHQALYGFKSETHPDATMSNALRAAYENLQEEGMDLEEEERALDAQLSEYQQLLEIVDGENAGFGQLVDDWLKVQKETEDCCRDLRRLGWTGD
ncbi:putative ubiquinone biosynthesis monooxygenase [Marasmius crinis-equi]|uniref:Ubiquinone biosynthesis monooxygenase COQ6, mitochondrial n=1 Tax=Marasmius crinis-equi TaxID=585013 RepID=A0ABR3F3I9_9AGAR